MSSTTIQTMRESDPRDWSYGSNYVDGTLRLLSVGDPLPQSQDNTAIVLSEWRDLDLSSHGDMFPKYAAISHSWNPSPEAERLSSIANRPLNIDIGHGARHQISWHGLCQAARAAQHLQCDYLWLYFVCIHQTSSTDKKLQVQNMGQVYSKAEAVLIMPGGVIAAQNSRNTAPWITRAWTLQEATLCANTYVLILHAELSPGYWAKRRAGARYEMESIEGDLALSQLSSLLTCRSGNVAIDKLDSETGAIIDSEEYAARCFGDDTATIAGLEGILHARNTAMKTSAVWRSIWMRTSTKPQDMVFSVMHLLGVHIDVDYSRTREDLILELARKSGPQPAWLDIGFDIPFEPRYGLLPPLPPFDPNRTPAYIIGDQSVPVEKCVTASHYVLEFNIKILHSGTRCYGGDLLCAEILDVHRDSHGTPSVTSGNGEEVGLLAGGELESDADAVVGSHVMVLGTFEHYGIIGRVFHPGPVTFQLRKSETGVWERVGGKTYIDSFTGTRKRNHLRVGGPPGAEITPCGCDRKENDELNGPVEVLLDTNIRP